MGMPERGEQVYNGNGDHKVKSKSTSFDPASGTVTTVDAETGKTLTVPKHIVDSIMGFASAKPSSEKDQAAIRKSEAEIGKIEAQRAAIEAGKPTDPKVAFQLDQARKDQEAEIRKAEYGLKKAYKDYQDSMQRKPGWGEKEEVKKDQAAKVQAFEDAKFAVQEARKRYGLDTTPPPGVAAVNPQQQPVAPAQPPPAQAPGYVGSGSMSIGGNTVNIKGGNIGAAANPTHDAYNYLDSVIKSGKHPKTRQSLTPAQMMLAKQKMAALKNQMLGKK
jgi:Skp family chaperone for outer membrane proteins